MANDKNKNLEDKLFLFLFASSFAFFAASFAAIACFVWYKNLLAFLTF
jgi:hypothetical protein